MMGTDHGGALGGIVRYFADSKLTPLFIIASLLIGAFAVANLPREEEPQISVPMFDILVSYPGASAKEMEQRIVNLGERKLWEITGVEYIYSTVEPDQALIIVRFKVGEDPEKSLIKLYTKVYSNLDLMPPGASQPLIKPRSIDDVPVLALTFHGGGRDPLVLRKTVARVRQEVSAVPDVSETVITGGRKRQFQVFFDEAKLAERLMSPLEIGALIRGTNVRRPAGRLESRPKLMAVESNAFFRSKADLENLVVGVSAGGSVHVKDVARVADGPDEDERFVSIRGGAAAPPGERAEQAAVTLSISKRRGTNATRLCRQVLAKVEALKGTAIPPGIAYTVTRDYGETAAEKSNELLLHMAIAVVGVSILIAVSLGIYESGVVAVAVPVTLALTLASFYFIGFTLNRITLFALIFSIGILVDDPIVDVENIVRHLRMPSSRGRPILDVTVEAVNEVRSPLILATLAVIAAILPMAFVRGLMGPYMRPIPIGSSMAMAFSMAVAFIVTPWSALRIMGWALRRGRLKGHGREEREDLLTRLYRTSMKPIVTRPRPRRWFLRALAAMLLAAAALVPLKCVKLKMLPFDNKNEFQVVLDMPEGTPAEKTRAVIGEIAALCAAVPEATDIETYVGASSPYNFNGLVRHYFMRDRPHQADLQVNLVGKGSRKRQSHAIADSVRPAIHGIVRRAGGHVQVAEVPPGPPVLSTLVLEIYGPTVEGQIELAVEIEALLARTPGITDIGAYVQAGEPLARLSIDTEKASLNGIDVSSIANTVTAALAGQAADLARLPDEYEPVEILLRLPKEKRATLDAVKRIRLLSRFGQMIPVGDLTATEPLARDRAIYHKNLMRVQYVIADVTGDLASPAYAILKLRRQVAGLPIPGARPGGLRRLAQYFTMQPPAAGGWAVKWDGEWQITYEVFRDMGIAFAAVLILIYILVVGWFRSFKTPLVIMIPIPLSLIGILPAHWMAGVFFTATSMIGLIAGAGIVVRNAIILVDFIELRISHGMPIEEAVIDAGAKRFRPMLLTAAAVIVGSSVILFDPIFQGLALSLMAGEIASTLLSRTAVPVFYYLMMRKKAV